MHDALGPGFTLPAFGSDDSQVASFASCAESLSIPMKVIRDAAHGERVRYDASLILVRPDQYVAWAGDAGKAGDILERASGRRIPD